MDRKIDERILCSFLHIFADCFLCVLLFLDRTLIGSMDLFLCFFLLILGMLSCLGSIRLKFLGDFFIPSVVQTAAFLMTGYESGSFAPLFFIPFVTVCCFILDRGRFKKWLLPAGGAWGTYVLFGAFSAPMASFPARRAAYELVFSCVLSAGSTTVMMDFHLKRNEKKMQMLMRETKYLTLQTDELADQNCRDRLTGLPNRRYYDLMLPKLIGANEELGVPLSLIVTDIDFFKKINDTYGHATGDRVLSALGDLISTNIRPGDIACRYGGEEFVVLIKAGADAAAERAELLHTKAAGLDLSGVKVTISCGVAQYEKGRDLFTLADNELYRAKELGRNRVCTRDGSEER